MECCVVFLKLLCNVCVYLYMNVCVCIFTHLSAVDVRAIELPWISSYGQSWATIVAADLDLFFNLSRYKVIYVVRGHLFVSQPPDSSDPR